VTAVGMRADHGPPLDEDLQDLLARAARVDVEAFMRFYDATSGYAFSLAVVRARLRGLHGSRAREVAGHEVGRLFVHAWRSAAQHRSSGLSSLAWLLTLDVPEGPLRDA
jgi:hypothetical protein